MNILKKLLTGLTLCTLGLTTTWAQDFPSQHITLIVPYTAGGTADGIGRALGQELAKQLNTTIIVENKPGAGASIGTEYVAKSEPDGHTWLLVSTSALTVYPHIGHASYDPLNDFIPLASVAISPVALAATKQTSENNFEELLQTASKQPEKIRYGTPGVGTNAHLGIEQLSQEKGIKLMHVPYKGNSQALTDAVGGAFELLVTNADVVLPHAERGALKPLAVMAPERLEVWPDTPTLAELGYPEAQYYSDFGLFLPAGTPEPIVNKIFQALEMVLHDPNYNEFLNKTYNMQGLGTLDNYAQQIKNQYEKNGNVIANINLQAN